MIDNIKDFEKAETRKLLNQYEVPVNCLAYKYLVTAMPYAIEKVSSDEKINLGELYKEVAKKHKTTANKVNWVIRYLCDYTDIAKKIKVKKATNGILITSLAVNLIEKYDL